MVVTERQFFTLVLLVGCFGFGIMLLIISQLIKFGCSIFAKKEMRDVRDECDIISQMLYGTHSISSFFGIIFVALPFVVVLICALIIFIILITAYILTSAGITF